jgi:hypothetical protein
MMDDRFVERRLLTIPPHLLPLTPSGPVTISVAPDARHAVAFAALRPHGGPSVLVRDEPRGAPVQGVLSRPAWSFDGGRFACVLQGDDGRQRVVVDEAPSPSFAEVLSPVFFSPAGSSFSYAARERDRYFVLVDHSPVHEEAYGAAFDAASARPPRWATPPANAAAARRAAAEPVLKSLMAGDALETPAGAARLEFDMRGIPLLLRVGAKSLELQRAPASSLEGFAWDDAGRWGALLQRAGRGTVLVLDGAERETRGLEPFLFCCADGSGLIYGERRATGLFVVVGPRAVGPLQWLGDLESSPDGRAVAFPALEGRDVRWIVVPAAAP